MDDIPNFLPGFKSIQQFTALWKDAEARDDPGPRLAALFTIKPCPVTEKNLHILLKATFMRYCYMYHHDKIRSVLSCECLRKGVEARCHAVSDLVKNVCSPGKVVLNAENPDGCNATLMLLLSEPVFRATLTEFDFNCLLRLPIITAEVVDSMIAAAEDGVFDITAITHAKFHDFLRQNPNRDKLKKIGKILDAAYKRRVERLTNEGSIENTGVILDREYCAAAFPTPFHRSSYSSGCYPYTSVEVVFNSLSSVIRHKDNWRQKCCDPVIVQKWREELAGQADPRLFELVIEQLRLLRLIGSNFPFEASPVDGVFQSDCLLSPECREAFCGLAARLEAMTPVDFHPGSKDLVVDLVHPSLFPAVSRLTRVRARPTRTLQDSFYQDLGSLGLPPLVFRENKAEEYGWSNQYCWIPAEFHVRPDGSVDIVSYINNLHPKKHPALYSVIADIFAAALPMVEQVLSEVVLDSSKVPKMRLIPDPTAHLLYDSSEVEELDHDDDEAVEEYYNSRVPLDFPLPDTFPTQNFHHFLVPKVTLRDKRLQVIVKMATIELTPENPEYGGGTWHVEGMRNEDIVCSVIHYYSCENITESRLNFRQAICEPLYEQNDERGTEMLYHLRDGDPLNQDLGYIVAREGRTVAFPNTLQHRVSPFELADRSAPGHRKILVYFLVNPLARIASTANIPPQNRDWAAHGNGLEVDSLLHCLLRHFAVPDDIVAIVYEYLDFPLDREEAEKIRESLMHERSFFVDELTAETFERPFSLCEH